MIHNVLVVQHHLAAFPDAVRSLHQAGMTAVALNTVHLSGFLMRWSGATFDGLLLDAALTDDGAHRLAASLRQDGFAGAIVVFNAGEDEDQVVAYLDAGADDVLATTMGVDELVARVRAHLARSPTRPAHASLSVARAA